MSAIAKLQRKKLVDVCMDTFLTMTYTTAKRIKSFTSVNHLTFGGKDPHWFFPQTFDVT